MHTTLSLIAATTTTIAGSKKSSGSSYGILIIVLLFAAAYFLLIRPRQQKLRQQQVASRQMEVGDEVVTAGGIHGKLVSLGDDTADVEVSPGVVLTFLRRAVSVKTKPAADPAPPTDDAFGEHDDHSDGDGEEGHHAPPQAGDHEPGGTAGPAT